MNSVKGLNWDIWWFWLLASEENTTGPNGESGSVFVFERGDRTDLSKLYKRE